jgi:hypothetical protein
MTRAILAAVFLTFSLSRLGCQEPAAVVSRIDPTVSKVTIGGGWRTAKAHGYCRLIVVSEGWEAVHNTVFLQWITEGDQDHAARIVATTDLRNAAPGWFSFFGPTIVNRKQRDELTLTAAPYPLGPEQALRFEIGSPGQLKQIGHVEPKLP